MTLTDHFATAIEAAGLVPPSTIAVDGKLHRFSPTGKRGDDAGWFVFYSDVVPAGAFGDWRTGLTVTCCTKSAHELTDVERRACRERIAMVKRMRDAEQFRRQAEAAAAAQARWHMAVPCAAHPYLAAKGVKPHGLRVEAGYTLLVPMRDAAGKLHSLQCITPDGVKRFHPGGRVRGCYHAMGRPIGKLIVCEGLATASTVFEATAQATAAAFCASNLLSVAQALRTKFHCLPIILAADDDWKTEGNPGLTAARHAAAAVGGLLAVPNFAGLPRGDKDSDFNDLIRLAEAAGVAE